MREPRVSAQFRNQVREPTRPSTAKRPAKAPFRFCVCRTKTDTVAWASQAQFSDCTDEAAANWHPANANRRWRGQARFVANQAFPGNRKENPAQSNAAYPTHAQYQVRPAQSRLRLLRPGCPKLSLKRRTLVCRRFAKLLVA